MVSGLALAVALVATLSFSAVAAEAASPQAPPKPVAGKAVLVSVEELKWNDVAGFPGVKMAVVQGDPNKGPAHFFIKFPGGFSAAMHFHNADHWVAVVTGTVVLTPEGGAEKSLSAGSAFGFTGKKKHITKCAEGADCVLFVDARAKWDVIPVDKK
jgi:uncharacterized cupin superfamily protein